MTDSDVVHQWPILVNGTYSNMTANSSQLGCRMDDVHTWTVTTADLCSQCAELDLNNIAKATGWVPWSRSFYIQWDTLCPLCLFFQSCVNEACNPLHPSGSVQKILLSRNRDLPGSNRSILVAPWSSPDLLSYVAISVENLPLSEVPMAHVRRLCADSFDAEMIESWI